jgi:hypothetical protein
LPCSSQVICTSSTPLCNPTTSATTFIRYNVGETDSGPGMQFTLEGDINGQAVNETFELPKDKAYNFASEASRRLEKHGLPRTTDLHAMHGEYDQMFEDIRHKLDMKSGDPVKPEHLE